MSFAAPLWLLVGALALVVVLLHTLRRTRVDVPSVILWRGLTSAGRSRRVIRLPRVNLLLLLQVLAVLALALALAQPSIGPGAARPMHQIFLIDGSASMRSTDVETSRFEAALASMGEALTGAEDGTRSSVLLAAAEPRLLYARQTDSGAVAVAVESLITTDGTADWAAAAARLQGIVRADEDTRIVIFTDGRGDPAAAVAAAVPAATVETRSFGDPATGNAGVTARLEPVEGKERTWLLSGIVAAAGGPAPAELVVRFKPEGGESFLDWARITLTPPEMDAVAEADATGMAEVPFSQELQLPSGGTLVVSLPADIGPADDTYAMVLTDPPRRAQVLYLGAGSPPLQLALLARGDIDLFSSVTPPADYSAYDLVIADGIALPERPAANLLWLGSAHVAAEPEPIALAAAMPTAWQAAHPLSDGIRWSSIGAEGVFALPPLPGATPLLRAGDSVLLDARTTPRGREVRVGVALDTAGWAGTPQFPVFLSNLFDWLGFLSGEAVATGCVAGEPCRYPTRLLGAPVLDADGAVAAVPVTDGEWLLDDANSFVPDRAGLYSVTRGSASVVLAVNGAPGETDIRAVAGSPAAVQPVNVQLGFWLLLLALALLALEAWLAGRGQERFLQRESLADGVPGARMRRWVLGFRAATLVLVIAALASLPLPIAQQAQDAVLVVDPGIVGDPRRPQLIAELAGQTCAGMPGPSVGLVALAATPYVAGDLPCPGVTSTTNPEVPGADIGAAVELAAALVGAENSGRVIVAGDGNDTGSGEANLVQALRRRGIAVDVLPLADWQAEDSLVGALEVPDSLVAGDTFPLAALIHAQNAGDVHVTVTADGLPVSESDVALVPGANRVDSVMPEAAAGTHTYGISIASAGDPVPVNNGNGLTVEVLPKPLVAIVTPQTDWGKYFADALALQGIESEVMLPKRSPFYIEGWLKYSAVALLNVPAIDLDTKQQEQLEQFVGLHGRGLLILGGENSFGPGGYFQTPLEAVSPLSARVPKDMPVVAIAFVLDRSGSMQAQVEGVSRLEIAKEATVSAIELLNEESQVAVVVFDTLATTIVPVQPRGDNTAVVEALATLQPGGGTAMHPGLEEGLNQLETADVPIRHIVLMSDGLSQPGDFASLAARARQSNITISTVAIGNGADVRGLAELARAGGGVFHVTQDFRALPSILSQEAMMMGGEAMEIGVRPVGWVDRSEVFTGLPETMPAVEGYVLTSIKPQALMHLASLDDEGEVVPIMASWRYGNGSVLGLATHGAGPGSVRWLELPQYPLFWAQIVRNFLPTTPGPGMTLSLDRDHGQAVLVADVLDPKGKPVAGLAPVATLSRDGVALGELLTLVASLPGRYTANFDAAEPGLYSASVTADDYTGAASLSIPYPQGLDFSRAGSDRLAALAEATGGRVLAGGEPLVTSQPRWSLEPAWRPWVLLALTVLLADLAMRYLPGLFPFLADRARRRARRTAMAPA